MICPQMSHLVQSPWGTFPRFCSTGCRGCFSLRNQLMDVEASLQRCPGGVKREESGEYGCVESSLVVEREPAGKQTVRAERTAQLVVSVGHEANHPLYLLVSSGDSSCGP